MMEPIYCGAFHAGANICTFCPGREYMTLNFTMEPRHMEMVGAIELAMQRTVAFLSERRAFGAPLLANQSIQYELADIAAELDMLRHHNWAAVSDYLDGQDITRHATVAKLRSARLARRMADAAVQFHGGMGFVEENWTARFFRDTRLWSIGGGADEVMLRTLARMNGITGD